MKKTAKMTLILAAVGCSFCSFALDDEDLANIPASDFIRAKYNKLEAELLEDASDLKQDALEEWSEFKQMVSRQSGKMRAQYKQLKNQLADYDEATAQQKMSELKAKIETQIDNWKETGALTAATAKQKAQLKLQEAMLDLQEAYAEFESRATSDDEAALNEVKSKLDAEKAELEAAVAAVCAEHDKKVEELNAMLESRKAELLKELESKSEAAKPDRMRNRQGRKDGEHVRRQHRNNSAGDNIFGRARELEVRGSGQITIVVGAEADSLEIAEGAADYRIVEDKLIITSAPESAGLTLNLARPMDIELKGGTYGMIECRNDARLKLEVEEDATAIVRGNSQSASIDISDNAVISVGAFTVPGSLKLECDDSGKAECIYLNAGRLFVEASDNSLVTLKGKADSFRYETEENGRIERDEFEVGKYK